MKRENSETSKVDDERINVNAQQDELIVPYILQDQGNASRPLYEVMNDFVEERILVAPFQREFVWRKEKVVGWVESVITRKSIGVIVTYQLRKGSPIYLADGLQRLTATTRFLNNPQRYGHNFGRNTAEKHIRRFTITVQHRIYESHYEALTAFQNLNNGTGLLPGEYFKGNLSLFENGRYVYENIPNIVDKYETNYITQTKSRFIVDKKTRDSFALFYQYVTEYKGKSFWNAVSKKIYNVQVIEKLIADYVDDKDPEELEKVVNSFERFIYNHYADFDEIYKKYMPNGKSISYSLLRWILHFHLWCNFNDKPYSIYRKMVERIIEEINMYKNASSKIQYEDEEGLKQYYFTIAEIKTLDRLADILGVEDFGEPTKKRKKGVDTVSGWDAHHPKPFSIYGDGDTVPLPSIKNRSIGNREVVR